MREKTARGRGEVSSGLKKKHYQCFLGSEVTVPRGAMTTIFCKQIRFT